MVRAANFNVCQRACDRFAIVATALWAAGFAAYEWLDRDGFTRQLMREHSRQGAGIVEHLTFSC